MKLIDPYAIKIQKILGMFDEIQTIARSMAIENIIDLETIRNILVAQRLGHNVIENDNTVSTLSRKDPSLKYKYFYTDTNTFEIHMGVNMIDYFYGFEFIYMITYHEDDKLRINKIYEIIPDVLLKHLTTLPEKLKYVKISVKDILAWDFRMIS